MKRWLWVVVPCVTWAVAPGCDSEKKSDSSSSLAPTPDDVHAVAGGCYAVRASSGAFLSATADGAGYEFTAGSESQASRFRLRASDLATYLFYDTEKHYLTFTDGRLGRVAKLQSSVELLDDSFKSPAEWVLQESPRDAGRFQLEHYETERYLTLTGLTDSESDATALEFLPQSDCAEFPELTLDATGTVEPRSWPDGDVFGIAEIHSHMMSNFGFGGGGIFHGAPFHRLGVEHALPSCEPWHGVEGRRDLVGLFYDDAEAANLELDALLGVALAGEASEPVHNTDGYPNFTEWPSSWKRSTHQTMYYRWLERAYLAGLRLLVNHATGNSVLCELVTGITDQGVRYSCNDMVSVKRSIAETYNLERYIDAQSGGPGKGWLRVVDSPQKARQVIGEGKLAVVLGIEISNLFDCFVTPREGSSACTPDTVRAKLDEYQALGVSMIFPVHKYDNAFAPGDGSGGIIELGNLINSGHYSSFVEPCVGAHNHFDGGDVTFGGLNQPRDEFDAPPPLDTSGFADNPLGTILPFADALQEPSLEGDYCQSHSLTSLGETLVNEMMRRGMIVDLAHLPRRAMERTYQLLEAADYPATTTHNDHNEGRIYRIGGMVGSGFNRCAAPGQMMRPFQELMALAEASGSYPSEALSFDLNGFAGGPRPRFGPDSPCGDGQANPIEYPFTSYDGNVTFTQPHLGARQVDFNTEGMIHIGLLPEYLQDVRNDGASDADLEPLFRSAEAFIRLWERAETRAAELR